MTDEMAVVFAEMSGGFVSVGSSLLAKF